MKTARAVGHVLLWSCLAAYSLSVAHDFYRYVDRSVYLAVDDGEANISYALAQQGRYAFLSSPILVNQSRLHGQFNYGPWYFYFGGGLIWLVGYSLTLIRSIHLWVVLGTIGAAAVWFRGRDRALAAAAFGIGSLYCFTSVQWPMARPDSFVTAFAVTALIAAGAAIRQRRAIYWGVAGLAAVAAAFTHLIAWALAPAMVAIFGIGAALDWFDSAEQDGRVARLRNSALALALGMAAGVTMFYGSFGFDVGRQLTFLGSYRAITASPAPYRAVLAQHFRLAFHFLPDSFYPGVIALLVAGWLVVALSCWLPDERRRLTVAYVAPALAQWTAYLVSLGWYSNYHAGYAILNEVLAWWTLAALIWVGLALLRLRHPRAGEAIGLALALVVGASGWRVVSAYVGGSNDMLLRARDYVPISAYVDRVLNQLPARSTAWGTVMFGAESPSRVQLVQVADGLAVFAADQPEPVRASLAPSYLIWGYPEARDSMLAVLQNGENLLERVASRFPKERYVAVSMVYGPPYGVTRIYARLTREAAVHARPIPPTAVFDPDREQWWDRVNPPLDVVFTARPPLAFRIGYDEQQKSRVATRTFTADLPAGVYLIRATIRPGTGSRGRMLAVTTRGEETEVITELGPHGDYASYLADDAAVDLLHRHAGGALSLSQFDAGAGSSIEGVQIRPVVPVVEAIELPPEHQFVSVPASAWQAVAASHARSTLASDGAVAVEGDATMFGYQIMSALVAAAGGSRVGVRVPLVQRHGHVCLGVLNATEQTWLVAPTEAKSEYWFTIDRTGGFRIVVANCNDGAGGRAASQFSVNPASYAIESPELYSDRLMRTRGLR